jgi:DNA-binding transcriptional ArsR family regulator
VPPVERRIKDLSALSALAHPLRLRLYYALQERGEATATGLSDQLRCSVQLVSYHLTQLARSGFIEEAPALDRDKRQRWWRPLQVPLSWSAADFQGDDDSAAIAATFKSAMLAYHFEQAQAYLSRERQESGPWVEAAFSDDIILRLRPQDLQALHNDLLATLRRHGEASAPDDGARTVIVLMHGFPLPDDASGRDVSQRTDRD